MVNFKKRFCLTLCFGPLSETLAFGSLFAVAIFVRDQIFISFKWFPTPIIQPAFMLPNAGFLESYCGP